MKKILLVVTIIVSLCAFTGIASADSVAIADQDQGQSQGQGQEQGQTQDASNTQSQGHVVNDSFNSQGMRGFAVPGEVNFGAIMNYFGPPTPTSGYQPVEDLVLYVQYFTEAAAKSMMKDAEKVTGEFKVVNGNKRHPEAAPADDGRTRWIKVVISNNKKYIGKGNVGFRGYVISKSKHEDTTMIEVFGNALRLAIKNGCNVIHFNRQGAARNVSSSGWGIGFGGTQAQIYDTQDKSSVASFGTGYSSAKAGSWDGAWLLGYGLVDYDLEFPWTLADPIVDDDEDDNPCPVMEINRFTTSGECLDGP